MANGRNVTLRASAASVLLAAAALAAAPAQAQTGSGTGGSDDPYTCNFREDYYSCCPRWEPCTQFWIDAPLPPAEPAKPSESPEE